MGKNDTINFSNICDDALRLLSEANRAIKELAECERTKPETVKNMYYEVNSKCLNTIYSMLSEDDKRKGDIQCFDQISFLQNIGVIHGNHYKLKKSGRKKLENFQRDMSYQGRDAIAKILVIKRALLNTGCIVENEDTGALSRKYESNEYSNPIVERMQQMPINYEIYQEPESIKVPDDYISKGRPGSVSNPLSGGGWSPR